MSALEASIRVPGRGVDVRVRVADGEHLALVGMNGAGKSTVLEAIAGHLIPRRGDAVRVAIDGRDLTGTRPEARHVAYLAQRPHLFAHMSVAANVMYGPLSRGASRADARRTASALLERVGLSGLEERRPATLSGGQAQKVAVARALAVTPRVLLLDEPLAALDVQAGNEVRSLIADLALEITLVLVTHDVADVWAWADRLAHLEHGQTLTEGSIAEVCERPAPGFLTDFVGLAWVPGTRLSGEDFISDGGIALPVRDGERATGRVRALVDPSALTLSTPGEHVPGAVGRVGRGPVVWVADVPVALSAPALAGRGLGRSGGVPGSGVEVTCPGGVVLDPAQPEPSRI